MGAPGHICSMTRWQGGGYAPSSGQFQALPRTWPCTSLQGPPENSPSAREVTALPQTLSTRATGHVAPAVWAEQGGGHLWFLGQGPAGPRPRGASLQCLRAPEPLPAGWGGSPAAGTKGTGGQEGEALELRLRHPVPFPFW